MLGRSQREFDSEPGSIPVGAIVATRTALGVPAAVEPAVLFLPANTRFSLLVFLLVSAAIGAKNCFEFKWLWCYTLTGQGHQDENTSNNNSLDP